QRRHIPILRNGHARIRSSLLRYATSSLPIENRRAPIVEGYCRLSAVAVSDFRAWKKLMIQNWSPVGQTTNARKSGIARIQDSEGNGICDGSTRTDEQLE